MHRLTDSPTFFLAVAACSVAMAACQAYAGHGGDAELVGASHGAVAAERFDNHGHVVAVVAREVAR